MARANLDGPLLVEFAGLPGAGKTTITDKVIVRLRQMGYTCPDRAETYRWRTLTGLGDLAKLTRTPKPGRVKLWLNRLYRIGCGLRFLARPRLALDVLRYLRHVSQRGATQSQGSRGMIKLAALMKASHHFRKYDVIIWDDGLLNAAFISAIQSNERDSHDRLNVLAELLAPLEMRFACIDTPVGIACQRIHGRSSHIAQHERAGVLDWREPDELRSTLGRHAHLYQAMFDHVRQQYPTRYVDVVGSAEPDEIAEQVAQFIESEYISRKTREQYNCGRNERPIKR